MEPKRLYAEEALAHIPHILELLDRSPISRTYGCFDREYWHYKAKDFASGMYEECVLSLALIYKHDFPGNIYLNNPRILEYVKAGINFANINSHSNGSNDDYYPNEEALGSSSFSLYACTEAYILLELKDQNLENFFKKRASFVISKNESGTLANHHALAAMALYNVFLITKDEYFRNQAQIKIEETLSYQSHEGWFKEYQGCDPGYLTFTIDFLAKYLQKNPEDTKLKSALEKAVHFCFLTVHPDGTYGGEYGSRNTYNTLPNGFEILATHFPEAGYVRNMFLKSLDDKTNSRFDDDRIFNHYVYNYLQAYLNHNDSLMIKERGNDYEELFKDAGIFVRNKNDLFLISSARKGGIFKFYREDRLVTSDAGLILIDKTNRKLTSQVWQENLNFDSRPNVLSVETGFYKYSQILSSPFKQLVFRIVTIALGKKFSGIIRKVLQKILITGKSEPTGKLERIFSFTGNNVEVIDHISISGKFKNIYIPTDFTGIYIATSQAYTQSTLMPWLNYRDRVEELNNSGHITITRKI